jgi:hypothetical protein
LRRQITPSLTERWNPSMAVPMQLARIIISEISDNQVIYLKEIDGERQFPILIGIFEATSINRRVNMEDLPKRPLTHDLMASIAVQLGAEIDSVIITELKEETYYAQIILKKDGETIEIDARPSDAVALAVTFDPPLPIFASEEVLANVN